VREVELAAQISLQYNRVIMELPNSTKTQTENVDHTFKPTENHGTKTLNLKDFRKVSKLCKSHS
jgi:hypothetical protein